MKMLDLEMTYTHMLQVELPFLSGRWSTLPKQKPLQMDVVQEWSQNIVPLSQSGAAPIWEAGNPVGSVLEAGEVRVPQDTLKLQGFPLHQAQSAQVRSATSQRGVTEGAHCFWCPGSLCSPRGS